MMLQKLLPENPKFLHILTKLGYDTDISKIEKSLVSYLYKIKRIICGYNDFFN